MLMEVVLTSVGYCLNPTSNKSRIETTSHDHQRRGITWSESDFQQIKD